MRRSAMVVVLVAVLAGGVPNAPAGSYNCFGEAPTIVGTPGDDTLIGTDGPDLICGGKGDDGEFSPSRGGIEAALWGGPGVDKISGGPGNDEINGGEFSRLDSDSGSGDFLYGKGGDDHICDNACFGNNDQTTDSGDDQIFGGGGNDILGSTGGNDLQSGGRGNDRLGVQLWQCDETSCGQEEVDTVDTGADTYLGGAGDDAIMASDGAEGNDVVNGGDDIDNCTADAQDIIFNCE